MKIVKVTYTANPDFAVQNSSNIKTVMSDLRQLNNTGIFYHACLSPDGKTFIHTAFFKTDEDHKILNELPSFLNFQQQLKNNGFEVPPKQESLTLVGSSSDIFR
ncbi:MAG TPA: hypothetical protein VGI43_07755 [Mucilaginibacter sp.]|jgi:hypothetical protein